MSALKFLILALALPSLYEAALPTLYEYYTDGGITSGLSADQPYFTLNGKNISLHSGAIHYFRVPHQYWRDRLRKLRASGCNAVETYIPWNLHEPQANVFDFGDLSNPRFNNLNLTEFLQIAQEEDLLVLLRPGPFICAEWEFGGMPSWIIRTDDIVVRSSNETFMRYVTDYFNVLLPKLVDHQFTKGGPIIALQVENEYGSIKTDTFTPDKVYLQAVVDLYRNHNITELLYSSDSAYSETVGSLPGTLLQTVNFANNPEDNFDKLNSFQKNKPTMAMEYWTGWYDKYSEAHSTRDNADFKDNYERILKYPASVNMYMFHGGTSFGFLNGANGGIGNYQPITNSYDYDAPLAENGDYTQKYDMVAELLQKYSEVDLLTPDRPELIKRVAYPDVNITEQLFLKETHLLHNSIILVVGSTPPMELLPMNNDNGQSYGYVVYSFTQDLEANSTLTIKGYVYDTVQVMVNGKLISKPLNSSADLDGFGFWRLKDSSITLTQESLTQATVELIIDNMGRVNFGSVDDFKAAHKGLNQDVLVNGEVQSSWVIFSYEFKEEFLETLSQTTTWHDVGTSEVQPAFYRGTFNIEDDPVDTYIDAREWTKGVVIVNGFVLGRHFKVGPAQALYLPGPYLNKGANEIIVFEQFKPSDKIKFVTDMIFETV